MTKDFSYLENMSNLRFKLLGVLAFGLMFAILFGFIGFSLLTEEEVQRMGETQLRVLQLAYAGGIIMALIGAIVVIHLLGGVKPKDILAYQGWCQDEFKKAKRESRQSKT